MGAPLRTSGSLPLSPSMWEKGGAGTYPSLPQGLLRHPDRRTCVCMRLPLLSLSPSRVCTLLSCCLVSCLAFRPCLYIIASPRKRLPR